MGQSRGAGTFGKYLIRKVGGLKRQFSSKIQKYLGTFGLNDLNNLNRKFTCQNTFGPFFMNKENSSNKIGLLQIVKHTLASSFWFISVFIIMTNELRRGISRFILKAASNKTAFNSKTHISKICDGLLIFLPLKPDDRQKYISLNFIQIYYIFYLEVNICIKLYCCFTHGFCVNSYNLIIKFPVQLTSSLVFANRIHIEKKMPVWLI